MSKCYSPLKCSSCEDDPGPVFKPLLAGRPGGFINPTFNLMTITRETAEEKCERLKQVWEECDGDHLLFMQKTNAHTLKVSLMNEQVKEELFRGEEVTFFNEDNAVGHLRVVGEFLMLLAKNQDWGYKHTSQEVVDAILNPIKDRLMGEWKTYRNDEEEGEE